jgi:hypothetical protein
MERRCADGASPQTARLRLAAIFRGRHEDDGSSDDAELGAALRLVDDGRSAWRFRVW